MDNGAASGAEPDVSVGGTASPAPGAEHGDHDQVPVERVQTGVRIERRLLKVLKALAEYLDISLGDLIEGIALHAFEGRLPFDAETMQAIADLKDVYGLTLTAEDSHMLVDAETTPRRSDRV
jgi:hypothetical protein